MGIKGEDSFLLNYAEPSSRSITVNIVEHDKFSTGPSSCFVFLDNIPRIAMSEITLSQTKKFKKSPYFKPSA